MVYIGLDLGTSGLKAVAMSEDGVIRAEAHHRLSVSRPHDGWVEQDPHDWAMALDHVMRALGQQVDMAAVRGIGLAGHMHGAVVLDDKGAVLRPCILWNDTRAHAEAAVLDADPQFRAVTGNIVFAGFTAPKIAWLAKHDPVLFSRIAKVLLPKDYLRFLLTGDYVSDMSDAAGTAWLDTGKRDWDDGLLAATGLTRAHMPSLVEGNDVSGVVTPQRARDWGMRTDVVVAGGAGDNAAAAVGVGAVKAGQGFVSLGTSGVLFVASDRYSPDAATAVHSFCHAVPKTWHQMGVILAAADAVNWWARIMGSDAQTLTAALGPLQAPVHTLFLPYLGGERTPHNDPHARAAFIGLDHATDAAAMMRAVLVGTAHAFRDSLDALRATGTRIDSLIGVGGGIHARYWVEAVATALDMPVSLPVAGDFGAAFGAARLGQMAATGGGAEIALTPQIIETIDPVTHLRAAFDDDHQRYQSAYRALKAL